MPLPDDDEGKWIYKPHTATKHEVLQKYLPPWTNKLTSYNEDAGGRNKIRVIDCFAGRGSYVDTEDTDPLSLEHITTPTDVPGSPQLILDRLTDRREQYKNAECYFIEANQSNYSRLESTISETEGYSPQISAQCIHGEFENTVLDLVEGTDGNDCPTFFFIDPFGFSSLDFDIIAEIGSTPQFEFLITFMSRDMNRFLGSEDHQAALDNVFGSSSWQSEIEEYDADNWEPLVEYYTDLLEQEGPNQTFEYKITEPESRQTIYYLVFGSNHPAGLKLMREVMNGCGTGQFMYAPKQPEYDREQQSLPGAGPSTKDFLMERFGEFIITFEKLVEECSKERRYKNETESDYRRALHELEEEGKVDIQRITSAESGIQGSDLIDFHESSKFAG